MQSFSPREMDIRFFEKGNTLHKDEVEMKKAMFSLFMGDDFGFKELEDINLPSYGCIEPVPVG